VRLFLRRSDKFRRARETTKAFPGPPSAAYRIVVRHYAGVRRIVRRRRRRRRVFKISKRILLSGMYNTVGRHKQKRMLIISTCFGTTGTSLFVGNLFNSSTFFPINVLCLDTGLVSRVYYVHSRLIRYFDRGRRPCRLYA